MLGGLRAPLVLGSFMAVAPASSRANEPISPPDWHPRITGGAQPSGDGFHEPGVLFVNFDGGQMQSCGFSDDPVDNCSTIMNDLVLPYSGDTMKRAAIIQAVFSDVEDFGIEVVDVRPADDVDYDMVMVGDWEPPAPGGFSGVAPTIDCFNETRGETSFSLDRNQVLTVARIVAQEAAHVWGLEHVDSTGDLLYPTTNGGADAVFEDACHQIVIDTQANPGSAICSEMHLINCPDQPDMQNSYQDILMTFGTREPDTTAPLLEIVAPQEGEQLPSGEDFDLVLQVSDNYPPPFFSVYVAVDSDEMGPQIGEADYPGPQISMPVMDLPDGEHSFRVDVGDQVGNLATAEVSFRVGAPAGETGTTSGADETTGDSTSANDETGDSGSGETGEPAESNGDSGCGCRGTTTSSGFGLLALFLGLGLVIRRR